MVFDTLPRAPFLRRSYCRTARPLERARTYELGGTIKQLCTCTSAFLLPLSWEILITTRSHFASEIEGGRLDPSRKDSANPFMIQDFFPSLSTLKFLFVSIYSHLFHCSSIIKSLMLLSMIELDFSSQTRFQFFTTSTTN